MSDSLEREKNVSSKTKTGVIKLKYLWFLLGVSFVLFTTIVVITGEDLLVSFWCLLATLGVVVVSVPILSGIAVAWVTPPLRPISEISIFSRRVSGFMRLVLAVLTLFGTFVLSWTYTTGFDAVFTETGRLDQTFLLIGPAVWQFLTIAFCFYLVLIAVDLLRMGKKQRIEFLRVVVGKLPANTDAFFIRGITRVASFFMDGWGLLWMTVSFFGLALYLMGKLLSLWEFFVRL